MAKKEESLLNEGKLERVLSKLDKVFEDEKLSTLEIRFVIFSISKELDSIIGSEMVKEIECGENQNIRGIPNYRKKLNYCG